VVIQNTKMTKLSTLRFIFKKEMLLNTCYCANPTNAVLTSQQVNNIL